ncbi:MAG: hypothetical protein LBG96_06870 [Tannerella sp.]|jgi:hypothetical protein|nr:hypothetical protein [Tannerella sp.]
MCKKETQGNSILKLFQDPRYIPEIRPLQRELPNMPIMVSKPYPESNPHAWIQRDVSFFSTGEYTIDEKNNIYFKDPDTGKDVYLNKIDTASYTHKIYAEHILTDLSRSTNTVKIPNTNRDTTVYAKGRVELYRDEKPNTVAHTTANSKIQFNYKRENSLHSNLYAILSTFRHEYMHVRDIAIAEARNIEYSNIGDLEHADIYKVQMTYEEFRKAPIEFQQGIIGSYAKFIIKECGIIRRMRVADIQNQYFDTFNNGIGKELKATITYRRETYNYVKIDVNGQTSYVDLKKIFGGERVSGIIR